MFLSAVVGVLYFGSYFTNSSSVVQSFGVTELDISLAAATFFCCFVTYLWAPQKHLTVVALLNYLLMLITTSALIYSSGGVHSSFIALWLSLVVFASIFGLAGSVAIVAIALSYGTYILTTDHSPANSLITLALVTLVPLVASYIMFHARSKRDSHDEHSYSRLATELTQEANKSSTVIRAIEEGVIAINTKGIIELINPAAERLIGWNDTDALGLDYKSVLKLTDKTDKPLDHTRDPVLAVLTTNKDSHSKEFYLTTSGGKRINLSIVISPIGQLGEGAIIVFRDITREQAEEREQAEFISTASHEMRTPVASIEGYLGLALNPATAQIDDKARDFIQKAHQSAQHLGRLFQDLLDVSKADDGRMSNHPSVVDVGAFVGDIAEGLRPKAEEKQLRLFYKPGAQTGSEQKNIAPVFYTHVDNDHLREVVQNLIENAIKYTPSGDVIVDLDGDDDHVKIIIRDSGIGIPKEDIPHLFQKFYRVDNSATREIGGTGLGLYLCRRLVEVIGGRIWLESEFQKGSSFFVELPRIDRDEAMRLIDQSVELAESEVTSLPHRNAFLSEQPKSAPTPFVAANPSPPAPRPQMPPLISQPPAPLSPSPAPASVPAPTPVPAAPTLASIEQNPSLYTQRRPANAISIPVRTPEQ